MPGLRDRRVLSRQDLATLENYCLTIGMIRASQRMIADEGAMVDTRGGEKKRHPAHQTLFQGLTESRRLAAELGLTPASRSKAVAMPADGDADDLADLDL